MRAREGVMRSQLYGEELSRLYPVVEENLSDSGSLDCVLEFLIRAGGRSLPEVRERNFTHENRVMCGNLQAAMTMVPEAWEKDMNMNVEKKAFYNWSAMAMEPWDGPGTFGAAHFIYAASFTIMRIAALLTFSDGRYVGAILDRNGLRPARYYLSDDNVLYMSSETGVTDLPHERCVQKVCLVV